ncbi:hypothetical protein HRE20_14910, partial [Enterococcus faecalis]|nr:hypothetical protein [Enterococcus faecalis]
MKKGKNDLAWEKLFYKYNILDEIDRNEIFSINSKQINEFREARLMTKFDHSNQLPEIFSKNRITILPDSRGNYILGKFKMFEELKYKNIKPIPMKIPNFIRSLDISKITSESSALNIAHMSSMIDYVMPTKYNEPHSLLSFIGRMSRSSLHYTFFNIYNNILEFAVNNAQIEIYGSYENLNSILIVEAKHKIPFDFTIRHF